MAEIGVDIGGTFTDIVVDDPAQGLRIVKVPSTGKDPSIAVLGSVATIGAEWGVRPDEITRFVHGTTVSTNAVLERKGARLGLLATAGFSDVIDLGRQIRTAMYDLSLKPETPTFLAPGRYRRDIPERLDAEGKVIVALDEEAVRRAVRELAHDGVEAIAVCYLFSFLNPTHERRTAEIVREEAPELFVSLSCDVDPAFREYERNVVTAFDAYTKPVIDRYLARLERGLAEAKVSAPLQIMQSRGGVAASGTARQRPVRMFLSGPAAGVIGARLVGRAAGEENIISLDMGGTSCDIALVEGGAPVVRQQGIIDGYPVRVPMVDVNAIGSGGGSIAWIDAAGGLRVGPESAGSEPGPACYGRGGTRPTVTDASIVLGYIDPDYFAGGTLRLDPAAATKAIDEHVARPLGKSVEEAALGIYAVVNAQMAEAVRLVTIKQGFDPREFAMIPLGGAGSLHVLALAEELGMDKVIVPRHPGVLSAAGLLAANVEHEAAAAFAVRLDQADLAAIGSQLESLRQQCEALMQREQVELDEVTTHYFADVCYVGQSHTIEIDFEPDRPGALGALYDRFIASHDRIFGHSTHAPAQIVNLRAIQRTRGRPDLRDSAAADAPATRAEGHREILLEGHGRVRATILPREAAGRLESLTGPAVIEQSDTTILLAPGWTARTVAGGHLEIRRTKE